MKSTGRKIPPLACAALGLALLSAASACFGGAPLDAFRNAVDDRLEIRRSFGVRYARALGVDRVELVVGMSVTSAAGDPTAYRIVSFDDPAYAYPKFVRPLKASMKTETDAQGVKGCGFAEFGHVTVVLELPTPLQEGKEYHVIAQGAGSLLITAAHAAGSFVFHNAKVAGLEATAADQAELDLAVIGLRRVEPAGPKILRLELGPGLAADRCNNPGAYKVTIDGKAVEVENIGRISRVDTYIPTGWPFAAIPMHEVFIELSKPWPAKCRISVAVDPSIVSAAHEATLDFDESRTITQSIKTNQLGYITDSPVKVAYLGRWMGSFPEALPSAKAAGGAKGAPDAFWAAVGETDSAGQLVDQKEAAAALGTPVSSAIEFAKAPVFRIIDAKTMQAVFEGNAKLIHRSGEKNEGIYKVDHSAENVYELDFTAFRTEGDFFIQVPGLGRSLTFAIGKNVYRKAFEQQAYGVFAQRSSIELGPPHSAWHRIANRVDGSLVTDLPQPSVFGGDTRELPERVQYQPVDPNRRLDPALVALDTDSTLLARWPLDGDLKDATGHGHDLKPSSRQPRFAPDERLGIGKQVLGPTPPGGRGSLSASGFNYDPDTGVTICGWLRHNKEDFGGRVFGFGDQEWNQPKLSITSYGGVLVGTLGAPAEDLRMDRIGDGKWHHIALVVDPKASSPRQSHVYLDGQLVRAGKVPDKIVADHFCVAGMDGKETEGKFFADVRAYGRSLSDAEIELLAALRGPKPIKVDTRGGHHDAGDYNPRSHIDVAQTLLTAYEIAPAKFKDGQLNLPESGNGIPDIVDEADWALMLWRGLQDSDGGVYDGVESNGDPNFIQTVELDKLGDYAFAKDTAGTLYFAGAMAQSSRVYKALGREDLSRADLERALRAWDWAQKKGPPSATDPGLYSKLWVSPQAYAAAQLLRTTGEPRFKEAFAAVAVWTKKPDADVQVYQLYDQELAAWEYVKCDPKVADPGLQELARAAIVRRADGFIKASDTMAYKFVRNPWAPISWGTGAYEHWLRSVVFAWSLTGEAKYHAWMIRTCDNTLGANPLGISYIVGIGQRTIRAPLHNSRFSHMGEVVNGMQVEGPNQKCEGYHVAETFYPRRSEDFGSLQDFVDCHFAIAMDEGVMPNLAESMAVFGLLMGDEP